MGQPDDAAGHQHTSSDSLALLIGAWLLLCTSAVIGGFYGATRPGEFGVQTVVTTAGSAVMVAAAALAAMALTSAFCALVSSGLPSGLDLGDEAAPSGRIAAVLVVLAGLLVLSGLMLVARFPQLSVVVSFVAIVLARLARSRAVPGSWQVIVATTMYVVCAVALVLALGGR